MGRPASHHFEAEFRREVTVRVLGVLRRDVVDEDGNLQPFVAEARLVKINNLRADIEPDDLGITDEELLHEARACVESRLENADRRPL